MKKEINKFDDEGWIPITEDKPRLGECVIVSVKDHIRRRMELRYPVYYMENAYASGFGFYFGDSILLPDVSEVVAWMPMPKPYDEEWE